MSQIQSPDHSGIESSQPDVPVWDERSLFWKTQARFRVLQALGVAAAILVMILVIQKPIDPAPPYTREGDLASVLIPILASAIAINLFIEMGFSLFEQSDQILIAYLGRGLRWLKQAQAEVGRARQWQMDIFYGYSYQLEELDRITLQVKKSKDPQKVVELAVARIRAARELLDVAEARVNNAENNLDRLVDHSSYRRFKWSVITYFSILLGLLVATVTSMQIFATMGMQLSNPKLDTVLTGLFIGGLVYPVHQVIANIWEIITKLVKK